MMFFMMFFLDCFSVIVGPHSTKLPQARDTESDQLGVPVGILNFCKGPMSMAVMRDMPSFVVSISI